MGRLLQLKVLLKSLPTQTPRRAPDPLRASSAKVNGKTLPTRKTHRLRAGQSLPGWEDQPRSLPVQRPPKTVRLEMMFL